jgi:hypothetical protein
LHLVATCISLVSVAYFFPGHAINFDGRHLLSAVAGTSVAMAFIPFLALARFSFGYIVGFGFYSMIIGFVWLSYFSEFAYDHAGARLSAYLSLFAFILPVLFYQSDCRKSLFCDRLP